MTGSVITDLNSLIAQMEPHLNHSEYVFCCISTDQRKELTVKPVLEFVEAEGIAIVITKEEAQTCSLTGSFPSKMITLKVYSSLNAVGFLAAITTQLAACGISVQPVSAFHHDYLFVPADRALDALAALQQLRVTWQEGAKENGRAA